MDPMANHLNDDDLVLHYYGEMGETDEKRTSVHLRECAECSGSYRRLQRVLAAVDEAAVAGPELPESFERTVWARLESDLPRNHEHWLSWLVFSPARLAWAAAVVMLVAGAFFAGRMSPRAPETPGTVVTNTPAAGPVRDRILLVDLGDHLDRSQMVLVEVIGEDIGLGSDLSGERSRAEQLVAANRLYRQTAAASGDTRVADLLDELERVLVDVAAGSPQDVGGVQRRIESGGLLFKVRVLSSELRERQNQIIQGRAGQRSSL
jgi:hypothetical protein